jgi:hypothetical protein
MQLLALTPAEAAFLDAWPAVAGGVQGRLERKLAATLTARLRLPVRAVSQAVEAPAEAPAAPSWHPDAALATLWLTRRLGGRDVRGETSFVPASLLRTLDAALAECWLDRPADAALPPALGWQLTAEGVQAQLRLLLPKNTNEMTRWAREVIRNG